MRPPRRGIDWEEPAEPDAPPRAAPLLWDDVPEAPTTPRGPARAPRPAVSVPAGALSPDALFRVATYYLARYSAPMSRLRAVLERKVRRRCELRGAPVPEPAELRALVDGVVERLARAGLVDDAAYGRGRAAALARKGWPAWRIRADLGRQGVEVGEEGGVAEAVDLDEEAQARRLAQRKRLGPYRPGAREPHRERDIRALARAGFPVGLAMRVVDSEAE